MEETDAQLHLKKRARRRLVGAVAFVALVAVVLPIIMDQEPKPVAQDVEIRIPGQDEKPFAPNFANVPSERPTAPTPAAEPDEAPLPPPESEPAPAVVPSPPKAVDKPAEKPAAKPPAKTPEKAPEKTVEKAPPKVEKPAERPSPAKEGAADAKRAAAILAGKAGDAAAKGGEYIVMIGAFANEANVKNIRNKLGEMGIKVYTEPLDSPQGKKTRVRAGPFPNREAADKALERMKRIGVSGVVAAK